MTGCAPPRDLVDVDWVTTRFGSLAHIAADRASTVCGRIAFEFTDWPGCWHNGRACSRCVTQARTARIHREASP